MDRGSGTLRREWRPGRPLDVRLTLASLRHGPADPTYRTAPDGTVWRTALTPDGPATLHVISTPGPAIEGRAWGPGAAWMLDRLPAWLGDGDDDSGFLPQHSALRQQYARRRGWRVPRTELVLDTLVPAILEQKVTSVEAHRAWRLLVQRFGETAPIPADGPPLRVAPEPARWARIPSWEWRMAGVDHRRSSTVILACRAASRLERTVALPSAEVVRHLCSIPGIGPWTAAETMQRAHGDADAVSVGDYHIPSVVGLMLIGRPVDDEGMLTLLEPYRGHRYRVTRLAELSGVRAQRRGPKARLRPLPGR